MRAKRFAGAANAEPAAPQPDPAFLDNHEDIDELEQGHAESRAAGEHGEGEGEDFAVRHSQAGFPGEGEVPRYLYAENKNGEDEYHERGHRRVDDGQHEGRNVEDVHGEAAEPLLCEAKVRRQQSINALDLDIAALRAELLTITPEIKSYKTKRKSAKTKIGDKERTILELKRFRMVPDGSSHANVDGARTLNTFAETLCNEESELRACMRGCAGQAKKPLKKKFRNQRKLKGTALLVLLYGVNAVQSNAARKQAKRAMHEREMTAYLAASRPASSATGADKAGHDDVYSSDSQADVSSSRWAPGDHDSDYSADDGGEQYFMSGALAVEASEQQSTTTQDQPTHNSDRLPTASHGSPSSAAFAFHPQEGASALNGYQVPSQHHSSSASLRSSFSTSAPPLASTLTNDDPFADFGADSSRATTGQGSPERRPADNSEDDASDYEMAHGGSTPRDHQAHGKPPQPYADLESEPVRPSSPDRNIIDRIPDPASRGACPQLSTAPGPPASPTRLFLPKTPGPIHSLRKRILQIFQESTPLFDATAALEPESSMAIMNQHRLTDQSVKVRHLDEYVYLVCSKDTVPQKGSSKNDVHAQFATVNEANNMCAAMMSAVTELSSAERIANSARSEPLRSSQFPDDQLPSSDSGVSDGTFGRRLTSVQALSDQIEPITEPTTKPTTQHTTVPFAAARPPPPLPPQDGEQAQDRRQTNGGGSFGSEMGSERPRDTFFANISNLEQEDHGSRREMPRYDKKRWQVPSTQGAVVDVGEHRIPSGKHPSNGSDRNAAATNRASPRSSLKSIKKSDKHRRGIRKSKTGGFSPELGSSADCSPNLTRVQYDPFSFPLSDTSGPAEGSEQGEEMDTTIELPLHPPSAQTRQPQHQHGTTSTDIEPSLPVPEDQADTDQKISVTDRKGMLRFKAVWYRHLPPTTSATANAEPGEADATDEDSDLDTDLDSDDPTTPSSKAKSKRRTILKREIFVRRIKIGAHGLRLGQVFGRG